MPKKQMNLILCALVILPLLLLHPSTVFSNEEFICPNETGIIRYECLTNRLSGAEALMNRELESIFENISSINHIPIQDRMKWQSNLTKSQEIWIDYKNKTCEIIKYKWFGAAGGSGSSNGIVTCHVALTLSRVNTLRRLTP